LGHFDIIFSHSIKPVAQRRRLFMLGQRIRQILSRVGRDAVAPQPIPPVLALRGTLLERYKIDIVLDVGANAGQYGKELRAIGYKGKIVSFEPLSSAYKELLKTANADGSWKALSFALGDTEGKAVLNIAGNSMSSSILDMLPSHVKSAPESQYMGKEQVEVRTLDSVFDAICSQEQNILLKIDTQGFEKHVLDGAERSLRFINTIQLEMSLTPLYQGELLFPELSQLLYQKGYRLASIEPGFTDKQTGQLLQIDGIFHRFLA